MSIYVNVDILYFCENDYKVEMIILTLNLLTTTIVAPLVMLANGRWDLIRRLKGTIDAAPV